MNDRQKFYLEKYEPAIVAATSSRPTSAARWRSRLPAWFSGGSTGNLK